MNIYDLDILQNLEGDYDLNQITFTGNLSIEQFVYVVDRSEEMRIDLICNSIYGDIDEVGFLLYYNNIDNPLNIKYGDIIRYVAQDFIGLFKVASDERTSKNLLKGINRSTVLDPNRTQYVNSSTNPTFNSSPVEQVIDRDGIIIIGNKE